MFIELKGDKSEKNEKRPQYIGIEGVFLLLGYLVQKRHCTGK